MTICGAPRHFRPAGRVRSVLHSQEPPPFRKARKRRGRRRAGEKYEERVHDHMLDRFGEDYVPNPWFRFYQTDAAKERWCQPDGLIVVPEVRRLIILEVKLQHTADAWWQVTQLYQPVLEELFLPGAWEISAVEVVRWFDPATRFPERPAMLPDVLLAEPGRFGVHIWKPGQ